MEPEPVVLVHPDPAAAAAAAARRLGELVVLAQATTGGASVVLTGGGVGIATLGALATAGHEAINWRAIDLWWGDERFLPQGHPDRNDTQAKGALLDHVDLDWSKVHPISGPDGPDGDNPEAAAERYTGELRAAAAPGAVVPSFDVLMLGMGPEGHVASIFPNSAASLDQRPVVAVRNCPKPPPTRVSMTYPTLNAAQEVWLIAAGTEKAEAVGRALAGADPLQVPSAGVHGTRATYWFLDQASATQLPNR